jgi:recombination DNA repair RAD52 pathway protein
MTYTYQIDLAIDVHPGTEDEYQKIIQFDVTVKDGLYYVDIGYGIEEYKAHEEILADIHRHM